MEAPVALPSAPVTLISVLMPVHNAAARVQRSIESVLSQTGVDLELIVVDDGSTDGSLDVIRSTVDERVQVLTRSRASGGPAVPRNIALCQARGDWIAFIDDDDYWLPGKLAGQAAAGDGVAVVYSRCLVDDLRGANDLMDYHTRFALADDHLPSGDVTAQLIQRNFVPMLTAMTRRSCLERVGAFNARHSGIDDYELWLRLALSGCSFAALEEPTAVYTWHPASLSQRMDRHGMHIDLFRTLARDHPEHRTALAARERRSHRSEARRLLGATGSHLRAASASSLRPDDRIRHLAAATRSAPTAAIQFAASIFVR